MRFSMTSRARTSTRSLAAVLVIALALVSAGCSSTDAASDDTNANTATTGGVEQATTTSTTTTPIPAYRSFIAQANDDVGELMIYDSPGGEQKKLDAYATGDFQPVMINNPLESGAIASFLVKTPAVESSAGLFHEVYLPVRPNFSKGFVRDEDVTIFHTDKSVEISLGNRTLSILDEGEQVASYSVAIGTDENPTPTGLFFIKELLTPIQQNGSYGALAYSLSGHSESILDSDEFPDGVVGVHGTNKPELIGQAVSHGCVRMDNGSILDLQAREIPLGTPVQIIN